MGETEPRPDYVHVVPVGDLVKHDTDGRDCVCGPTEQMVDGGWIVTHHSLDGREAREEAA